ncbi:MAG TPA: NAD(P)/FAD-dependent oxidoreductase [Steroidobacteraceae bacterium]|nr:NAD(P)/FAD-dependent oxidoreductase [Steroidobacteraceae bacterium]
MTNNYDVVAMGAGHNGLVAAAYLAKAGKKVLVLERKAWPGGGVVTREINTPGYWHDEHSSVHIMIQGNPMIRQDELGLQSKFGLKYHYGTPYAMIFPDQTSLIAHQDLDKTCEGIARISRRDAETYRRFAKRAIAMLPMFGAGLYVPPTPMGAFVTMLDGSEQGRDVLEAMQRSSLEIANQSFESEKVKIWLLRLVSENLQLPDELGTGFGLYLMPGLMHGYGVSQPVGGSGKLSESLVRCIEHHGGEVRCNSEVTKILTSGGRATGVRLSTGEEFKAADGVIGAIHPHRLRAFLEGVPEPVLDRAERATLAAFSIMVSHYDLKQQAQYYAGEDVGRAIMLEFMSSNTLSEMLDDFDALKRGRISERVLAAGGDESINDPSRVPAGRGMFHGITFAPYNLEDGGPARWDEIAEQMGDRSLAAYRKFIKNLTSDNIVKRTIVTPLDHARHMPNSMVGGDVHGVAPYFYQTGGHRPTPELAQYTVPGVDRFYLVGPFQHPGGGVYGAGRATAIRMFEHLGMDFDKLVGAAPERSTAKTTGISGSGGGGALAAAADDSVTLYGPANEDLLVIRAIEREGNSVVVKGQAYGTMPLSATLRPEQARRVFKLLKWSLIPFLLSFLFRRSKPD